MENHTVQRFQAHDIRTYHCGTVPITDTDSAYHIAVVLLPSMGELAAANATTDALATWNPNFVLMVGIAGGIAQDDLDLGDVVVADQVVGYEYGKVKGNRIAPHGSSARLLQATRSSPRNNSRRNGKSAGLSSSRSRRKRKAFLRRCLIARRFAARW